jgi:Peptidase family M48
MKMALSLLLTYCVLVACPVALNANLVQYQDSQDAITNQDILEMVRAKISAAEIIARIKTARCHFDTVPSVLDELQYKGVPPAVLMAMIEVPYGPPVVVASKPDGTTKDGSQQRVESPQIGQKTQSPVSTPRPLPEAKEISRTEQTVKTAAPPSELSEEIALGLSQRSTLLSSHREIKNTPEDNLAQSVFLNLRGTGAFRYAPGLPYEVTIIDDEVPNAFALPGGHVYVTSAMANLLGSDAGLWAAVVGHELGHNIKQHLYKKYLRELRLQRAIAQLEARAAAGDTSANIAIIGVAIAGRLLNQKMERNDEIEADQLGLEMMVDAGYHPDFAITLYRKLRTRLGDDSKFEALFSSHPRWATREQRVLKLYDEAVVNFDSRWRDAASSPGGAPPIIATLGKVSSKQDKLEKRVVMQIPYSLHNAKGVEVDTRVSFSSKGNSVPSLVRDFQTDDGSLTAMKAFTPVSKSQSGSVEITVPTAAIAISERKLKARFCFFSQGERLECSKETEVSFPKN